MIQNESNLLALSFDKLLEFLKDKLFNVYIAEAFIKDDKGKKRFSLLRSATSTPATYYKLDELVQDSMQVNVDPVELTKYAKEFESIYSKERAKVDDIKGMRLANGNLRHRIKELQSQYSALNRDHVDIVQKMVDLKTTLPDLVNENEDLKHTIEKLEKDVEELESKTQPANDVLPSEIEDQIQQLLVINAQEVEKSANLEEELNSLLEQEEKLTKLIKQANRNSTWFKWNK